MIISSCVGTTELPPVDDQSRRMREPVHSHRVVVAGDTLYSIAWEIGQDYRTLAEWNKIEYPYIIRPGQKLSIKPLSGNSPGSPDPRIGNNIHTVVAGDTLFSLARQAGVRVTKLAEWNNVSSPYVIRPGQRLIMSAPKNGALNNTINARNTEGKSRSGKGKTAKNPGIPNSKVGSWSWPTKGKITSRFGKNGKKGLEITGQKGQPILAAAAGQVVYQGSGLRGYGKLVILKHNQEFLSAYAHCDKIVVSEGDVIKKGQQIASMGNTGSDKTKLHFEIRYRGTPVNPEQYLRRR